MTPLADQDAAAPPKNRALWIAAGAIALLAVVVGLFIVDGEAAGWLGGIGAVLFAFGLLAPHRGGISVGVLFVAVGSLVATADMRLSYSLLTNAAVAVALIAALVLSDLSFVARRATAMSPVTVRGFAVVHLVTTVVGVTAAALALGAALAVEWPGWLVIVPAVALAGAALVLTRLVQRYRAGLIVVPQPPPPTGPPRKGPPVPRSRPVARDLRQNIPQPPPPRAAGQKRLVPPPPPPRSRPPAPDGHRWPSSEQDRYQW